MKADLTNFMNNLKSKQNFKPDIDEDYPQYRLPTYIVTERSFQSLEGEVDPKKERAFTIANKALPAIESNKLDDAKKMCYHALNLDPLCIDAWRMLCSILNQTCDGDTIVCALREVIDFSRPFFESEFKQKIGKFYQITKTRPYIRLLTDLAKTALRGDQLDVAIYAYEEVLRLNHSDNMIIRDPLLCCYIKIIGRVHRYPNTTPKRTIEQAEQLINAKFDGIPLFSKDRLTVRWSEICFAFIQKKKNWEEIAKKEYVRDETIFKILFNEIGIPRLPPPNVEMPNCFLVGNKMDEIRSYGYIKEAMEDWPNLLIELRRLFRGKVTPQIAEDILLNAPNPDNDLNPLYKQQALNDADVFLDQGRTSLAKRSFTQSVQLFTFAKNSFDEAFLPSRRWYLHAPFAIASNVATAAYNLQMWNLLRIDSRFTLLMKPEHERSYLRLPIIAKAFGADQLGDDFNKMVKKIENKEVKNLDEWKNLAKNAIGLLSLPAMAYAAAGKLTNQMKQKFIEIGIENMYITVNDRSVNDHLPWLKETDFEPEIPDI